MDGDEDLDLTAGYFDLGLTSLRLNDIKQQLESALEVNIDATAMLNLATLNSLIEYLSLELSAS